MFDTSVTDIDRDERRSAARLVRADEEFWPEMTAREAARDEADMGD